MKIDLDLTKHRAILFSPSIIMILILIVDLVAMFFGYGKEFAKVLAPYFLATGVYTIIISFILLVHDTRRDHKKYRR